VPLEHREAIASPQIQGRRLPTKAHEDPAEHPSLGGQKALTTPVVGDVANDNKLVDLHTSIFLNKADEDRREERRAHLDSFFDATMDTYVAALEAGFPGRRPARSPTCRPTSTSSTTGGRR